KTATFSGYTLGGSSASSYSIANATAAATADITPKALTITADDQSKTYGELFSFDGSEFSAAGLVNGDTVASVSLSSDGAPETAAAGGHSIVASGATGPTVGNYSITYNNGTLTVNPKALTIASADESN